MIQKTLFNYFNCNDSTKQSVNKSPPFKQTNLTDYFKIMPKKKNLILDYFKPKDKEKEEEKAVFDLVLVDIWETNNKHKIVCEKRNMYDSDLKYIAISYRWGEFEEQQLQTPDYTAHITSFDLGDLNYLCCYFKYETDLKEIRYLWIDAISVDQQNHTRKKETILKMNRIYKNASYILAVPDFHLGYLWKNTANKEVIELIFQYKRLIHEDIFNISNSTTNPTHDIKNSITNLTQQQQYTNNNYYSIIQKRNNKLLIKENEEIRNENKELKMEMKEDEKNELKKAYQFLAYLIDDWSNRAWVISEYHIAKEKYINHGIPLKYMFLSLKIVEKPFFSYYFDDDGDGDQWRCTTLKNNNIIYYEVDGPETFNQFIRSRFMQRLHLDMILNSNATRNEDRFNAILPSWDKYHHIIKNKNTVSEWKITNMTSVILKLYEIMDDLWDKARLLHSHSKNYNGFILPTFASYYESKEFKLIEIDNINNAYKRYEDGLLKYIHYKEEKNRIKQLIDEYKMNSKPIWTENLTSIRLVYHHPYLSVKSDTYFIYEIGELDKKRILSDNPLLVEYSHCLHYVCIPFFTYTIPDYTDVPPLDYGTYIHLIGNIDKNKWMIYSDFNLRYLGRKDFCSKNYIFNIY